ncbi:major facilitator superfamily transporter [mine drainage metagenome]|uniref:Major facilitator superfamily transporter n=2 Tax=mine drainage metagenome TaxID=410659 RepID=T1CFL0_9ZZZZ
MHALRRTRNLPHALCSIALMPSPETHDTAIEAPIVLPAGVIRLMAIRAARSLGQGALVAAFALYLHALGWHAAGIGATLSAALLIGAVLTLLVGPLSDRIGGRRRFLLVYELLQIGAALLAIFSTHPAWLVLAAVVGGFGRGANGSAGPFGPIEQAWLALLLPAPQRGRVYSWNTALGFSGMALGALAAGAIGWFAPHAGAAPYRWLFGLSLLGSLVSLVLLFGASEPERAQHTAAAAGSRAERAERSEQHTENRLLLKLVLVNSLNGLGIGMIGPLIAYWFLLKFAHGPGSIGPAIAASFALGALGSVLAGRLARQHGLIRSVVWMRLAGLLLLLAIPFSPWFILAAGFYALRAGMNQGTAGVRQALVAGLTRDHRRGLASSLQNVSIQIPRAIGPLVAGLLLHAGMLTAPFVLTAIFQGAYLILYAYFFRDFADGGAD